MSLTKVSYSMIQGAVVNVLDFGAVGNGTTDDTAAIQAAINSLATTSSASATGGGTVYIPAGKFRITSTIKIGYGITLIGNGAGGYPFIGANSQMSQIYADFGSTVNQWAIDSATYMTAGGAAVAYNAFVNGSIDSDFNSLHNVAIKGLVIRDANEALQTNVPWGAIRLVGCPNAIIDSVSIVGFGIGVQLNTSFGTSITKITTMTNYYGLMCYNANNNIYVQGQFDKIVSPSSLTVPVGRRPSWLPDAAYFASGFYMDGNNYSISKGILIAADNTVGTNGATLNVILQYWENPVFLYNSYATTFTNLYAEGSAAVQIIACTQCSWNVLNLHNYTVSTAYVIDAGYQTIGEINVGGNNLSTTDRFVRNLWTSVSPADPSNILIHNASNVGTVYEIKPRLNYNYLQQPWTPTVTSGSGTITTVGAKSAVFTLNGGLCTIQFDVVITTNGTGATSIVIGNLPYLPVNTPAGVAFFSASGGRNSSTNKALHITAQPGSGSMAVYYYDGTYPAADGARLIGTISYAISY
jgi:hypothetical protein